MRSGKLERSLLSDGDIVGSALVLQKLRRTGLCGARSRAYPRVCRAPHRDLVELLRHSNDA
jgi:hypothetical protein